MIGEIEGRRKRGWQRRRWLDGITNSMDTSLSTLQEMVKDREAWQAAGQGVTTIQTHLATEEQQRNQIRTELKMIDWASINVWPNQGINVAMSSNCMTFRKRKSFGDLL